MNPCTRTILMSLCLITLATLGGLHAWSRATLIETRASAPPSEAGKPFTIEQREAFNVLHRRAERLMIAESLLLLAIAIASSIALCRKIDPVSASALPPTH